MTQSEIQFWANLLNQSEYCKKPIIVDDLFLHGIGVSNFSNMEPVPLDAAIILPGQNAVP